ncbi:MAG: hypothetical protein H5U16_01785 [Roseovarius sp.]|nr:hypothetical protein [Roseovarius sp.]
MKTAMMRTIKLGAALILGLGLAACASTPDTADRGAAAAAIAELSLDIRQVRVTVPETLTVSEANVYSPRADIVWREDPPGDRRAQVRAIVENALGRGIEGLPRGKVPAMLDVQVTRFHALTQKTRYTVGGTHAIHFTYVLRDARTGEILTEPRAVDASFRALGGQEAIEAESKGITQKVRITQHLANVIRRELGGDPAS